MRPESPSVASRKLRGPSESGANPSSNVSHPFDSPATSRHQAAVVQADMQGIRVLSAPYMTSNLLFGALRKRKESPKRETEAGTASSRS